MAEGARLERVYTGNRIEGSNPSLSASVSWIYNGLARSPFSKSTVAGAPPEDRSMGPIDRDKFVQCGLCVKSFSTHHVRPAGQAVRCEHSVHGRTDPFF